MGPIAAPGDLAQFPTEDLAKGGISRGGLTPAAGPSGSNPRGPKREGTARRRRATAQVMRTGLLRSAHLLRLARRRLFAVFRAGSIEPFHPDPLRPTKLLDTNYNQG